jgi:hypothetical protein
VRDGYYNDVQESRIVERLTQIRQESGLDAG